MPSACPPLAVRPRFAVPLLLLAAFLACSVFTYYPQQMRGTLQDFEEGRLDTAYEAVEKEYGTGLNQLLYLLEGGMILHCRGAREQSNEILAQADGLIRKDRERAVVSLSQGTAQLGSLLVNEKTIPYRGAPFEQVLVQTFKATNYLFLQDNEGARVEIRRSFATQQENRRLHQKELQRMEQEAGSRGLQPNRLFQDASPHYRDQEAILSRARNPYEDPFAYYLSAVVYELNREYNDALIDLKRVEALRPGVPFVQNDLLRMAQRSGLEDEVPRSVPSGLKPRFPLKGAEGELILIFECGMAPRKAQITINLPIPDVGIVPLAFPKYECVPSRIQRAALTTADGRRLGETYVLTDVEALAVRNLMDRMEILVLKQAIRASAKGAMAKTAGDQGGVVGAVLSNTYNLVTEQADLRSWLTLPQNIQVARVLLPVGPHDLKVSFLDASGIALVEFPVTVDIRAQGLSFLNARSGAAGVIDVHAY